MKLTKILFGLPLITNITNVNSQIMPRDLITRTELLEKNSFDDLAITGQFSDLSAYEDVWLNSERSVMVADVEACKQMYASMMAACYAMGFNPPAFAACAAAAVAAYGACLAANS